MEYYLRGFLVGVIFLPQINGTILERHWQCLGLYAMPGTLVTVTLPSTVVTPGVTTVHIGGWTDLLYKKSTWYRLPDVVRRYTVSSTTTTIASAYGGLIYVDLPKGNQGSISVSVTGGSLVALGKGLNICSFYLLRGGSGFPTARRFTADVDVAAIMMF
jgi:hypothetical protein